MVDIKLVKRLSKGIDDLFHKEGLVIDHIECDRFVISYLKRKERVERVKKVMLNKKLP